MSRSTCKTCDYYDSGSSECRVEPPKVVMIQHVLERVDGVKTDVESVFPAVTPDLWCASHSGFLEKWMND